MQDEFRVGCWDGEFDYDTVTIQHDSMEEPLEMDFEEIYDLGHIIDLLHLRMGAEHEVEDSLESLEELIRDLEA